MKTTAHRIPAVLLTLPTIAAGAAGPSAEPSAPPTFQLKQVDVQPSQPGQHFSPTDSPLVDFDQQTGTYCSTSNQKGFVGSLEVKPCNGSILYVDTVWMLPRWQLACASLLLFVILFTIFLRTRPWKLFKRKPAVPSDETEDKSRSAITQPIEIHNGVAGESRPRDLGKCMALAFWMTIVGYSSAIWLDSIYHEQPNSISRALWFLVGAVVILFATFVLEGLEEAYSELRDKDELQFEGSAARLFLKLKNFEEDFYETREWSIVALVVLTTLMIEIDPGYWIPEIGFVSSDDPFLGHWVRWGLSFSLSTFPFVWFAQSPGKHVARTNSAQFLRYAFTHGAVYFLKVANWFMRRIGLLYPSHVADDFALRTLKRSQQQRSLPPSELSFFTDGLKKYGYGTPLIDDVLTIFPDGSVEIVTRHMSYAITPRSEVTKKLTFEKGFVPGTRENLVCRDSPTTRWWAFDVPMMGERVDNRLLGNWIDLFYQEDPDRWTPPAGYHRHDSSFFEVKASITPYPNNSPASPSAFSAGSKCGPEASPQSAARVAPPAEEDGRTHGEIHSAVPHFQPDAPDAHRQGGEIQPKSQANAQPLAQQSSSAAAGSLPFEAEQLYEECLTLELHFRESLPREVPGDRVLHQPGRALLLLWEITLRTNPGTVEMPTPEKPRSSYPYGKKLSHPSLRSTTSFIFQDPETIFVESKEEEHFKVKYQELVHRKETARFREQIRPPMPVPNPRPPQPPSTKTPRHRVAPRNEVGTAKPGDKVVVPVAITKSGPEFRYYLDSPLPGARYTICAAFEKALPKPGTPQVQVAAASEGKTAVGSTPDKAHN